MVFLICKFPVIAFLVFILTDYSLAKPVFGALLIWGHRNIEPARLGLNIRNPLAQAGVDGEKRGQGQTGTLHTTTAGTNGNPNEGGVNTV